MEGPSILSYGPKPTLGQNEEGDLSPSSRPPSLEERQRTLAAMRAEFVRSNETLEAAKQAAQVAFVKRELEKTAQVLTHPSISGQSTTPAPAAGSSLFGNTQANQTSTTGSGLFGTAASSTPKTGGGLFGAAPANNAQPQQQTSSLFGATNNNAAQPAQQQQQTGGGGLFGGLGNTQQQQQPQQQPQQTTGGGLFGGLGGAQQQQQQPQQQQQSGGGLFGNSAFAKPAQPASSFMNQSQARPGFGYVIPLSPLRL